MRHFKIAWIVAACLVTLVACAPAAPPEAPPVAPPAAPPAADTSADEAAIRAGTKAWLEAHNASDVERIVALYAPDAVVMPPHAPACRDQAALRAFLAADTAGSRAAGVTLVDGESSVGVSGNRAWHSGSFTVIDASGATVDSGNYLELWRKIDGKWLIVRDIWNSDRPIAAPGAAVRTVTSRLG